MKVYLRLLNSKCIDIERNMYMELCSVLLLLCFQYDAAVPQSSNVTVLPGSTEM